MSNKKRKSHVGLIIFLIILILIVVVAIVAKNKVKEKAAEVVIEKVITEKLISEIANDDGTIYGSLTASEASEIAKDFYTNLDEEDKQMVEEIINEKATPENISEAAGYISSGDTASLKAMAKEQLTAEEQAQIADLYYEYQDELYNYVIQYQ